MGARGFLSGFCCSMLQVMGLILSQSVSSVQQRTVVFPARGMQLVPLGQQRPEGRSGHADWEVGQVSSEEDWRSKREFVGMARVVAERWKRRKRRSSMCKRAMVVMLVELKSMFVKMVADG